MRNLSIVLTLLLTCATLPAQTATSNTILVLPPDAFANSCPVGFSVDRRTQGELLWTSSESEWINSHGTLSFAEMERHLENEPGFSHLSPQAQQRRIDRMVQLSSRQHGQGLIINFAKPASQIVSADIVVHGYPNSVFVVPASLLREDVTESFYLTASEGAPLLHSAIWTKRLMVRWVELTRLEYADGTTWKPSAPHQCHAAPSLYLPVSSPR